jgi:hypothetical protein
MDPTVIAPYLLRDYIWQVLKQNTDMKESDYDGKVPIVPLAEEPELTQYSKPYIVYGYAEAPSIDLPDAEAGSMSFIVYSKNFRELSKIIKVISRTFARQDQSAYDVNRYTSTKPQFIGLRFGYINVGFVEGGSPETTEGGRQSAGVNIRYEYYVDYNIKTTYNPLSGQWV